MKFRINLLLFVFSLFTVLLLPGFAKAADTIVIGQAIDLSGPNGSIGRDYVAGLTTYFDSVNISGGVNGKRIQYVVRDDHGDTGEAIRLVSELIKIDRADYLLGGIGVEVTQAVIASPTFAKSGHVLFAPLSDSLNVSRSRALFWRPSHEQEFEYIFSYFDKLGIKNVGIAYQKSTLNKDAYQFVIGELQRRGIKLVGTAYINNSPAEIANEALKLSNASPKMVIAIADTFTTGLFLRAFRKNAPSTFVAGTSLINLNTLTEIAGAKATEWTVFSQVVPNPTSGASALQSDHINMMKKFRDESLSSITLEGFAVGKTLVKAIQMEGSNRGGGLQNFIAHKGTIDLGGLKIVTSDKRNNMSNFVDIALFKKDGSLLF